MSRLRAVTITGTVYAKTIFPDHPDHVGQWGLIGGEDLFAKRDSFRSVGEAMSWCRRVLDGQVNPRWKTDGEILDPHTDPELADAKVEVSVYGGERTWMTRGRDWCELLSADRYGDVVRTDPEPERAEAQA